MLPCLLSILCVPHAERNRPLNLMQREYSLVYAKVIDSTIKADEKWGEMQFNTFRITHVYCGDQKLEGQSFFLPLRPLSSQIGGLIKTPWVKEGEEGVWCVENRIYEGKDWYNGKRGAAVFGIAYDLPARKGIDAPKVFQEAVTFAKTVETIDRAADCDKRKLLEKAFRTPEWEIARWAVWVRCKDDPDRLVQMVRDQLVKNPPNSDRLRRLIEQLDDDDFKVREGATRELIRIGLEAVPVLCQAMASQPSLERRHRMTAILTVIDRRLREGNVESPGWTILRVVSEERHSRSDERAFDGLKDLAQKYPGSWLDLEINVLVKLSCKQRGELLQAENHWNKFRELYWKSAKPLK